MAKKETIKLICGRFNNGNKAYWKDTRIWGSDVGDWAIVECYEGYAIVNIIATIETTEEFAVKYLTHGHPLKNIVEKEYLNTLPNTIEIPDEPMEIETEEGNEQSEAEEVQCPHTGVHSSLLPEGMPTICTNDAQFIGRRRI